MSEIFTYQLQIPILSIQGEKRGIAICGFYVLGFVQFTVVKYFMCFLEIGFLACCPFDGRLTVIVSACICVI